MDILTSRASSVVLIFTSVMRPNEPTMIVWRGVRRPPKSKIISKGKPLLKDASLPNAEKPVQSDPGDGGEQEAAGELHFINTTGNSRIEPAARRLVKSNAVAGRMKREKPQVSSDNSPSEEEWILDFSPYHPVLRPSIIFGSGIQDYMSSISVKNPDLVLRHVTTVAIGIYPMESYFTYNPFKLVWFDGRMTNNMLFHAAMYLSSSYLGLMEDKQDSSEATEQMGIAILLINENLRSARPDISDKLISAVSCLAMCEVSIARRTFSAAPHRCLRFRVCLVMKLSGICI